MRARHLYSDPSPAGRFVDPAVLARIASLELVARTVVDGFISGLHKAPFLGHSTDFAEHRPYLPGDDIRQIDWRLYARTDRFYVKQYEADTNSNCLLLLDVSASMGFASQGRPSKFDYGRFLAACLAYFSHKQRDRIGLVTFADDLVDFVPPAAKHMEVVLHTLDRAACRPARGEPERGGLRRPLLRVAEAVRRRGVAVLISDLYEEPEAVLDAVRVLRGRGNDVIVFHLLDPAEVDFPYQGAAEFQDLETGEVRPVVAEALGHDYRRLVAAHLETLGRRLGEGSVDYVHVSTATPLDHALFHYLSTRRRARRVR